jgi:prepilin-type N-terminal cleavage/methylation domain-containing protein/prepilin-type processing-associated H-X9-DG protein
VQQRKKQLQVVIPSEIFNLACFRKELTGLFMLYKFSKRQQGFTLVELLVVIAVVAVIGAFLFSAFSRARETSRNTLCSNNLKQIGLAMKLYAQDNAGFVPNVSGFWVGQQPDCAWADRILPYLRKTHTFECPNHELNEYVPGCPPDADGGSGNMLWDGSYELVILSVPGRLFTHESRLQHPASTISVLDGKGRAIQPGTHPLETFTLQTVLQQLPSPRHIRKFNVLFMDGHTKRMRGEEFGNRSLWTAKANS